MAAPHPALPIAPDTAPRAGPVPATGPRRPSRLGILLAACLLLGLYLWRRALPDPSPWLDLVALTAAWAFLLAVRAWVRR